MTIERRAGAPRLIDWTGERCVPWAPDIQVVYEHFHRYYWAAALVGGRRVLDVGSGEGFGSAILAGVAEHVQGIDVDERTVEHSRLNYAADNLRFDVGSALDLGRFEPGSFDAVVMFEIIEHVRDHDRVLKQVRRVLAPGGLAIISTPDRLIYSEGHGQQNPFHERELSEEEFRALVSSHFPHFGLWGQRTVAGSRLAALDEGTPGGQSVIVERTGDEWRLSGDPAPLYLVAVASDAPFDPPPVESYLSDVGLQIVREQEARSGEVRNQLSSALHDVSALTAALDAERAEISRLQEIAEQLQQDTLSVEARLTEQVAARTADAERERALAAAAAADAASARQQLRRVEESVMWRAFQKVRGRIYGAIGGPGSIPGRTISWTLRKIGRTRPPGATRQTGGPPTVAPIEFPAVNRPVASIIIPVHARPDLTEACLRSIAAHTDGPGYEVIVVDDRAGEDHLPVWAAVKNARVIHNETQLGFIRNNNLAAAEANGRYLVLLNNDTQVKPGWLRALVNRVESADDIGVVAPKLLYPDGTLQEAGGVIFSDGNGWNFGRGQDATRPEYNYVREIDYGSGAALLVRRDLWRQLGGFDERYLPMYYEDTDLCFAARDAGYRVVFEPRAEVIHVEGATAGTDVSQSSKRFQEINRPKFVEKWREHLAMQAPSGHANTIRRLSDRNRGPHVLVIDHRLPTPDRDSGSLRMFQILLALRELGCRVTFLPENHAQLEPYTEQLQAEGVEVLYGALHINAEIASIGPYLRMALVSRPYVAPQFLHVIRRHAPAAKIVYDSVDLHYLRERRQAELAGETNFGVADSFRELEHGIMRACDVTAVVTEEERVEIERELPGVKVTVLPNANPVASETAPPDERSGLIFVGGFEHTPNIDAAKWLVQAIMPRVWRELGDVSVSIIGADPPADVVALNGPGVDVLGWVPDLQPLLERARINLAPLRYGAGMKGKVTQSLAIGLPVVSTSIGAEGLGAQDGRELLIADDPDEFAARVIRLYSDDELWKSLSEAGRALVERVCSPAVVRDRLRELLELDPAQPQGAATSPGPR